MARIVWYRSLYWRIGAGFVLLVGALLSVQGLVFLWMTGQADRFLPGRSPAQFAELIAADVSHVLTESPDVDLESHVRGRFGGSSRSFAVATRDGRLVVSAQSSPAGPPPIFLGRSAMGRLAGVLGLPDPNRPEPGRMGPPPGEPGRGRGDFGRGDRGDGPRGSRGPGGPGPGGNPAIFAAIVVNGATAGMVAVSGDTTPWFVALRDGGPVLGLVALGLLAAGTVVAALVVFRPAHRRLRALEAAARDVGRGQPGIRASEAGGDEVSALAHTFNEMAGDLEARAKALAIADATRRQLLADISHELATPLSAIRGYSETLAMPGLVLDEATRHDYLQIVREETERLEHIVGDLLDLAKLEGGGAPLKREAAPVEAIFERLRRRHEPQLTARHISFEALAAPDTASVVADAARLEQALQNLVANAIRHTPEGGCITVRADRVPAGARLVVEDNGSGIPDEHLPRVFDRFYKVDVSRTGTAVPSGSGLGLSIVQAIVTRHGGTVAASNRPSGGARFEIVLPPD